MKKYNKITKNNILSLFKSINVINSLYICKQLGCSKYLVRNLIEELKDDGKIEVTQYGYKLKQ